MPTQTTPIDNDKDANKALLIKQAKTAQWVIVGCILAGLLISMLFSLQAASLSQAVPIAVTILVVAGAALVAGGFLGFLFGIPKKLQETSAGNTQQDKKNNYAYQENTNLEQISDWLTKILVGVGLTQLAQIPTALQNYANYTAAGFGNFASSKIFAIALLLYFLICGFLIVYLWTRLYLGGLFEQAEERGMEGLVEQIKKDPGLKQKGPSTPEFKNSILPKIKAAAGNTELLKNKSVAKWLDYNNIKESDL